MVPHPSEELPIELRLATPSDIDCVIGIWHVNYFHARNVVEKQIDNEIYNHEQKKLIHTLIKRSQVVIAFNKDDPEQIFGWLVGEYVPGFSVVHYLYVKESFRRLHIGTKLFDSFVRKTEPTVYTHHTRLGMQLGFKWKALFNPYWGK